MTFRNSPVLSVAANAPRRLFSNIVDNHHDKETSSNESLSTAEKADTGLKPARSRIVEGRAYKGTVGRVCMSCMIYLKASDELRNTIDENSRFYYLHKRLRVLSPQELEGFKLYFAKIYPLYKYPPGQNDSAQAISEGGQEKKKPYVAKKGDLIKFVQDPNYGSLFQEIFFDFLDPSNRDQQLYIDPSLDERQIGKIQKYRKLSQTYFKTFLTENHELFKIVVKAAAVPRDEQYSKSYGRTFRRVTSTCLTYLDSPDHKKEIVDETSRFYYVKHPLDSLDFEQRKSFRAYLRRVRGVTGFTRSVNSSLENKEDGLVDQDLPKETPKRQYIRVPSESKMFLDKALSEPVNGPLLKSLILKFLEPNNRDLQLYLDRYQEEKTPGKLSKVHKHPRPQLTKFLTDLLEEFRKRFVDLDAMYFMHRNS